MDDMISNTYNVTSDDGSDNDFHNHVPDATTDEDVGEEGKDTDGGTPQEILVTTSPKNKRRREAIQAAEKNGPEQKKRQTWLTVNGSKSTSISSGADSGIHRANQRQYEKKLQKRIHDARQQGRRVSTCRLPGGRFPPDTMLAGAASNEAKRSGRLPRASIVASRAALTSVACMSRPMANYATNKHSATAITSRYTFACLKRKT